MPDKKKTFVDANVLITAFQGKPEISEKAFMILDDPEREFVVSDYLRLEVIPKPVFHKQNEELEFMKAFFDRAFQDVNPNSSITSDALNIASKYNLHAMDALHASTSLQAQVDELVTGEKSNKPLFNVNNLTVTSLYDL